VAKFYLTTAIDYSNGEPHLGHAVEKVGADVIARYRRACGDRVHFVVGMDEHGQKVQQEAEQNAASPQDWVNRIASSFQEAWSQLGLSNDDFIRTSEPRHFQGVGALMERIEAHGDFRRAKYEGYYCAGCEAFKKEDELAGGQCPLHPTRQVEWTEEENWFFELSAYADALLEHIKSHPGFVRPRTRRNEIIRFIESGLDDISASRARIRWGIPFPGDEDHTVYVWFDALSNYITALGYPDGKLFPEMWPADLHVIGKDITRFHCVYWPAMLMAAGVELPKSVWGHGFINIGGAKLSKSGGTELDLFDLIDRRGPDALRFFLMREVPWDGDRDFASANDFLEQFDRRYTTDLANDLGNLLNRVVSMISKYRDSAIPRRSGEGATAGGSLADQTGVGLAAYRVAMDDYLLHQGLGAALDVVRAANGFVDTSQPWALAKAEKGGAAPGALDDVLAQLIGALGAIAAMLAPFMPDKAIEMWSVLGGGHTVPGFGDLEAAIEGLARVKPGPVLFPRPEED